jgi:hypothetical protein
MFTKRRLSGLLVVLAVLAPLAACGKSDGGSDDGVASVEGASNDSGSSDDDSGSDGGSGSDRPSNEEFQDAALEYAQCMREQGIDMPDPEFEGEGGVLQRGPESVDQDEFEAADEECHHVMEDVVPDGQTIDPERQAEMQDQLLEVAQCMRGKGHDMPDPEVDDQGRVTFGMGAQAGERGEGPDEEFEQDMEDCQSDAGMDVPRGRRGDGGGVSIGGGGGGA